MRDEQEAKRPTDDDLETGDGDLETDFAAKGGGIALFFFVLCRRP